MFDIISEVYPNVNVGRTNDAGRALAARQDDFGEGEEILRVRRPLAALDSAHLQDACSNCYVWVSGQTRDDEGDIVGAQKLELKACLGCKIVKYCSKTCQSRAWKDGHKYECSIYKALHPNVLPNTVRLLLRPLLRRRNNDLPQETWESLLGLDSHVEDFKAKTGKNSDGLTTWETLELMSQALMKYSATRESLGKIQILLATVMVNSHTLTTPTLDPLGLALDPLTALLNHSCQPNAYLIFDGNTLTSRSLRAIPKGDEISIAYIDTTNPVSVRRKELKERYFFDCRCCRCWHLGEVKPDPTVTIPIQKAVEASLELQYQAASLAPLQSLSKLEMAIRLLEEQNYSRIQQPYPALYHALFLAAVGAKSWVAALICAMQLQTEIEPALYLEAWHPVRIVRVWVFLRLLVHIAGLVHNKDPSVTRLKEANIDFRAIASVAWTSLKSQVRRSHGLDSSFAKQVVGFGESVGLAGLDINDAASQWKQFEQALGALDADGDSPSGVGKLQLRPVRSNP